MKKESEIKYVVHVRLVLLLRPTLPLETYATRLHDAQRFRKLLELLTSQRFCQDISNHVIGWAVLQSDVAFLNGLLNEMVTDSNMLCTFMEY